MVCITVSKIIKTKDFKYILFLIMICVFTLSSCNGYRTKEPAIGITNKFFKNKPQQIISTSKYDFSRLEKGYGIVIFTYWLYGFEGDTHVNSVKKQGIRVWEYKFTENDEETKIVSEIIQLFSLREQTNFPMSKYESPTFKTIKNDIVARLTFKKNKIIYGGKIVASDYIGKFKILDYFDDDCSKFLKTYSSQLENIEIETILIKASLPSPEVKKRYKSKSYYDL